MVKIVQMAPGPCILNSRFDLIPYLKTTLTDGTFSCLFLYCIQRMMSGDPHLHYYYNTKTIYKITYRNTCFFCKNGRV